MTIDEIERTALVQQLISTLGPESASTLMKCVWPDGPDQFATKDDVARIVDERIAASEKRMQAYIDESIRSSEERMKDYVNAAVSQAVAKQTRWFATILAAYSATIVSAVIAIGLS